MAEYIEREALLGILPPKCGTGDVYALAHNTCRNGIRTLIKNAPAADVAPVRHGRWVITKSYNDVIDMEVVKFTCSVCGEYRLTATNLSQATNYCPNCGARMDWEVSE